MEADDGGAEVAHAHLVQQAVLPAFERHLEEVRGLIDQSHAGLISTAAMLAAILLGATAGRGSPDAMEGAILATQGAAIQH